MYYNTHANVVINCDSIRKYYLINKSIDLNCNNSSSYKNSFY